MPFEYTQKFEDLQNAMYIQMSKDIMKNIRPMLTMGKNGKIKFYIVSDEFETVERLFDLEAIIKDDIASSDEEEVIEMGGKYAASFRRCAEYIEKHVKKFSAKAKKSP